MRAARRWCSIANRNSPAIRAVMSAGCLHRYPMSNLVRNLAFCLALVLSGAFALAQSNASPDKQHVLAAMKRATAAMEKLSTNGGYVWTYLPDMSRRWGEMEA